MRAVRVRRRTGNGANTGCAGGNAGRTGRVRRFDADFLGSPQPIPPVPREKFNITIDGGVGTITIQSLTEITLSVAGGLSSITLTPAGITIQGILVQIN